VALNVASRSYIGSIYARGSMELLSKTQNEVWDFFEKLTWKTYAFEQANEAFRCQTSGEYDFQANSYLSYHFVNSYDPSYSCVPPILCNYCESPDHDAYTCPFRAYVDAMCASFEKKINDMTNQMIETMIAGIVACSLCFNQNRETYGEIDSSLESPKPDISLYDDFEPSYSARPDLNENMCLPNLEQESHLPTFISFDLASLTSTPKNVIEDILVYVNLPTTLNDFCEFDVSEQSDAVSELDISITPEVEPHDLDDSKAIS